MDVPKSIIVKDFDEILNNKGGAVKSRTFKPNLGTEYKFTVNNAKGSLKVLSNYAKYPIVSLTIYITYGKVDVSRSDRWSANVNNAGNFKFLGGGDTVYRFTPLQKYIPAGTPLTDWKFESHIYVDERGVMNSSHINGVATSQNLEAPCINC